MSATDLSHSWWLHWDLFGIGTMTKELKVRGTLCHGGVKNVSIHLNQLCTGLQDSR